MDRPIATAPTRLHARAAHAGGFTLVEVLISIAIALVLVLGISQIFGMAQRTTGAGNSILASAETDRAVHQTLVDDFRDVATGSDSPGFFICSQPVAAFRNRPDMLTNRQVTAGAPDPRQSNDPLGTGSLPMFRTAEVNSRIHRVDRMGFFMRDRVTRKTGDSSLPYPLTSTTTSDEAFVWIGHLALPSNNALSKWQPTTLNAANGYLNPGAGSLTAAPPNANDNNFFASDWILGREVVLLKLAGTEMGYNGPNAGSSVNGLSLLNAANKAGGIPLYMSRYDLTYTTMSMYTSYVNSSAALTTSWWQDLSGIRSTSVTSINLDQRYCGNPFPLKPVPPANTAQWLSAAVAQTSPLFVRGCTQFAVEFAGNYTTQDQNSDPNNLNYGKISAATPDPTGKIDFIPMRDAANHWARRIRWYGYPRDSDGVGAANISMTHGVMPLAWVANNGVGSTTPASQFEKVLPPSSTSNSFGPGPGSVDTRARYTTAPYVCAWSPATDALGIPRPKMVRIIMAVDDPTGHLATEQTYEYVFNLP